MTITKNEEITVSFPILRQHRGTIRKSCFGEGPIEVMDFFLSNASSYYTPLTASLSMEKPHTTVKDHMRLLKQNSYLSKLSESGSVYHITRENMEFWGVDFKKHVLSLTDRQVREQGRHKE